MKILSEPKSIVNKILGSQEIKNTTTYRPFFYLKQFEIIVKESDPWTIMSSYNVINGHRASENKELLEDNLRGEWGFQGMVTTDWWTNGEHYKEVLAGNDVKMATGFTERLAKAYKEEIITRKDLEICAKRVLPLILKLD